MNLKALISVLICVAGNCIASDATTQPAGQPDSKASTKNSDSPDTGNSLSPAADMSNDQNNSKSQPGPEATQASTSDSAKAAIDKSNDISNETLKQIDQLIKAGKEKFDTTKVGGELNDTIAKAFQLLELMKNQSRDCYEIVKKMRTLGSMIPGAHKDDELNKLLKLINEIYQALQQQIRELSTQADKSEAQRKYQLTVLDDLQREAADLQVKLQFNLSNSAAQEFKMHQSENALKAVTSQIQSLENEKADLAQRIAGIKQVIDNNIKTRETQESSLKELKESLQSIESEIRKTTNEIKKLDDQKNKLQSEVDRAHGVMENTQTTRTSEQAKYILLMNRQAELEGLVKSLETVKLGLGSDIIKNGADLEIVQKGIRTAEENIKTLKEQLKNKSKEKAGLDEKSRKIEEDIRKAKDELGKRTEQETSLNQNITALDANIASIRDESSNTSRILSGLIEEIHTQEVKNGELANNSKAKEDEYNHRAKTLSELNAKVRQSEKNTQKLEGSLRDLRRKIASAVKRGTTKDLSVTNAHRASLGNLKIKLGELKRGVETASANVDNDILALENEITKLSESKRQAEAALQTINKS